MKRLFLKTTKVMPGDTRVISSGVRPILSQDDRGSTPCLHNTDKPPPSGFKPSSGPHSTCGSCHTMSADVASNKQCIIYTVFLGNTANLNINYLQQSNATANNVMLIHSFLRRLFWITHNLVSVCEYLLRCNLALQFHKLSLFTTIQVHFFPPFYRLSDDTLSAPSYRYICLYCSFWSSDISVFIYLTYSFILIICSNSNPFPFTQRFILNLLFMFVFANVFL